MLEYTIKAACGFMVAFMAILAWSKTRDFERTCIASAVLLRFAGELLDILCALHILSLPEVAYCGVSIYIMLFTILPALLFVLGFICIIINA